MPFTDVKYSSAGNRSRKLMLLTIASVLGIVAVGCARTQPPAGAAAIPQQQATTQALAAGLSVSCAPGQRALMRQQAVNGQPLLDVQCVAATIDPAQNVQAVGAVQPLPQMPLSVPVYASAGYAAAPGYASDLREYAPAPRQVLRARPVSYRDDGGILTYQPRSARRVRSARTWQKSAVIIGSSAGVGAGIGAAIGGKKGALIGAAIGGGGAAIWDQASRRR